MDKIELALRRYKQLAPTAQTHAEVPVARMRAWLRNEACRAIAELVPRPTVRRNASWPIDIFRDGADTDGRRLIDALDTQLRDLAVRFHKLLASKSAQERFRNLVPPQERVVEETVTISAGRVARNAAKSSLVDDVAVRLAQLERLAKARKLRLANIDDYLSPQNEWSTTGRGKPVQRGSTLVGLNPDLPPIGDFMVVRLLQRMDEQVELLRFFRVHGLKAAHSKSIAFRKLSSKIQQAGKQLDQLVDQAKQQFLSGPDVDLREACVTATQVYAGFSAVPDLDWLGLADDVVAAGRQVLQSRITNLCNAQLLDRGAAALHQLQYLPLTVGIKQNDIDEAVATGGLVLVDHLRCAYWERNRLDAGLTKGEWRFLLALARKARAGKPMTLADIEDVGGKLSESVMSTTWSRLKRRLPSSLWRLVAPGKKQQATYVL